MSNEILKFADTATNILTQAEYAADAERNSGNIPGVARSKLVNKVLRQCAFISNAFAEYLISRVGGDVLDDNDTSALVAKITSAFTFGFVNPNEVINGNFDFWQENTTFNVSANKTYTADQWFTGMAGSTSVVSRQATAGTESFNARYFKRSTVTSSVNVANFNNDVTPLEDVRRLAGKQVTISFWAKADSSRNMSLELVQNFGTGGSPSAEVNSIGVEKFALTTSWQQFTKTVTLPSISGKVIGTNANSYTGINFWFDAGANYNSRTDSLGQQSGTFDIAQVKTELGSVATEFCYNGDSRESDLANCQRFFETSYSSGVTVGSIDSSTAFRQNMANSGANCIVFPFKTMKRANPTMTYYNPATGGTGTWRNSSASTNLTTTDARISEYMFVPNITAGTAGNFLEGHWTANARL